MLLVAVAVALPYPQDAASPADPTAAVPGADGLTADLRHHHGHNSGGYGDTWLALNIKSLIICRLCF
jgi:predicted histidine transporter YuiF (NhaC family)